MFDFLPFDSWHDAVELVRCFFLDHGQDLVTAASLLRAAAVEQWVIPSAWQIEATRRLERRSVRDLEAIRRLLSLKNVGDLARIETSLFAELHPSSAAVEAICRHTDQLANPLRDFDAAGRGTAAESDLIAAA
jgi:hypothetical protein